MKRFNYTKSWLLLTTIIFITVVETRCKKEVGSQLKSTQGDDIIYKHVDGQDAWVTKSWPLEIIHRDSFRMHEVIGINRELPHATAPYMVHHPIDAHDSVRRWTSHLDSVVHSGWNRKNVTQRTTYTQIITPLAGETILDVRVILHPAPDNVYLYSHEIRYDDWYPGANFRVKIYYNIDAYGNIINGIMKTSTWGMGLFYSYEPVTDPLPVLTVDIDPYTHIERIQWDAEGTLVTGGNFGMFGITGFANFFNVIPWEFRGYIDFTNYGIILNENTKEGPEEKIQEIPFQ
jgi:hypothetical protein